MTGSEHLTEGDLIQMFLSDETIEKFSESKSQGPAVRDQKHWPESFRYFMKMRMYCLSTSRADCSRRKHRPATSLWLSI